MKGVCPKCGGAITLSGPLAADQTAYCETCGWNIDVALRNCRTTQTVLVGVAVVGLILALIAGVRGSWGLRGTAMLAAAFIELPAASGLIVFFRISRLRKCKAQIGEAGQKVVIAATGRGTSLQELSSRFSTRPRRVKLSWRGWLYFPGVAGMAIFVLLRLPLFLKGVEGNLRDRSLKDLLTIVLLAWGLWSFFSFFRNRVQEWKLIQNGEVTVGEVLEKNGTRYASYIVYGFRDVTNQMFQKREMDFPSALYEEMSVHIFYDRDDPRRSVALESSLYRVQG